MIERSQAGRYKRCFACGRKTGKNPRVADTHEDQSVFVGSECYKLIRAAGDEGYQPPLGGPRLWLLTPERQAYFIAKFGKAAVS